jgi:hypothetical protein
MTSKILALALVPFAFGCATNPPPPASGPVAADNGQPRMQAALQALQHSKVALERASPNKGGHREAALGLIQQAIDATNAGIQFAAQHPTELGVAEPPAAPEGVDGNVPGSERQQHMHEAMVQLREARVQLHDAKHDKGGYRNQALNFVHQAMLQVREGINFANTH